MKFTINKPDLESKVCFWLECKDNKIYLKACHEGDNAFYTILSISEAGLFRFEYVPSDLGFALDDNGIIHLMTEVEGY